MKVILLKDVARIGRKYEVKDVPDGHAQNFLIPRKMAEPATPAALARLETRAAHIDTERTMQREQLAAVVSATRATPVVLAVPANEQGHLFKGLHAADIASALSEQTGTVVSESSIALTRPLKEVGEHEVVLSAAGEEARITVTISAA